jgi:hypothetical protein
MWSHFKEALSTLLEKKDCELCSVLSHTNPNVPPALFLALFLPRRWPFAPRGSAGGAPTKAATAHVRTRSDVWHTLQQGISVQNGRKPKIGSLTLEHLPVNYGELLNMKPNKTRS